MRKFFTSTAILLAICLFAAGKCARAQSTSQNPPPPDAPTPVNPPPAKDKNSQQSKPPAPARSQSTPPDAPAPATEPHHSTAQDNPFPEDVSQKAAADAKTTGSKAAPDAPSPANPATKQEQGSSSQDNTDKLTDDPARKQLKLESPDGSADIYDPKRATEDVKVGKFYLQTGHYKGAYDRFKDATSFDHENVEAVFYLAEAARKLNLPKEAEDNYQLYLAAEPDGPTAKAARKALGELGAPSKP
jgi:tetratricopeptide (TPR) repeat protein